MRIIGYFLMLDVLPPPIIGTRQPHRERVSGAVKTDAAGRFRLTGIGRDRLVTVRLDGPAIASQQLRILTRVGKSIEVTEVEAHPGFGTPRVDATYYGATFRHVAGATKPIVGLVRDRDTKKPLGGVAIKSYKLANHPLHGVDFIETTTDAQGRYRLTGMPKGNGNKIQLVPTDDQPYLRVEAAVPDTPGLAPVTVDFEMKRGVWFEGKVTDKATGKPLQGHVQYHPQPGNPHLRNYPGLLGAFAGGGSWNVRPDGTYRVIGLPGPGIVSVVHGEHYLLANERDDAKGVRVMFPVNQVGYNALVRVDPAKDAQKVTCNIALDPGETFTGKVVGPDGKPLFGVRTYGLTDGRGWGRSALKTAEFTVGAYNPRRPRPILFHHAEKQLVGVLNPPKEKGKPVTVTMRPGATVTGRLVDEDGGPRGNVALTLLIRLSPQRRGADFNATDVYVPSKVQTDRNGRFRIEALLPGYRFTLRDDRGRLQFGEGLSSGKTKDLGDVQLKSFAE
jgi:hypothetical protein